MKAYVIIIYCNFTFVTGDELHKKWKNIRDNFSRDTQQRKGKSGDGGHQKAPYVYTQRLQFLLDIIAPKKTINSLEPTETLHDESDSANSTPETSTPISTKEIRSRIGKKRLHPVEDKILSSLERYEKRANKPIIEDDNHYFALSLVPSLASLPRTLNTRCRLEIMQVISKYVTMAEPTQMSATPQRQPTYTEQQQCLNVSYNYQPTHRIQSAPAPVNSQQYYGSSQTVTTTLPPVNSQQQSYEPSQTVIMTLPPASSPAESVASYISTFSEDDSQISIFPTH